VSRLLRSWSKRRAGVRAALFVGCGLAGASCDRQPVIQVTSTEDGASGSLRAAISEANRATISPVRIEVPTGTYVLTRCGSDDDNTNGDLDVNTAVPVTIVAKGPDVTIRQTCPGERVLDGRGKGLLTLTGMTLTGGASSGRGGGIQGGAIALSRVTLTGNHSRMDGGGICASTVTLDEATITNNGADGTAIGGGMFVSALATIQRSTIERNIAGRGFGIASHGTVKITDSRVTNNVQTSQSPDYRVVPFSAVTALPGEGIWADAVFADRATIGNSLGRTCGELTSAPPSWWPYQERRFTTSISRTITARIVNLTNTTYSENFDAVYPGWDCILFGGGVFASESVSLDQVTFTGGRIETPELNVHRSAVCALMPTPKEASYNWLECGRGSPGTPYWSPDVLGPLADNGGASQTFALPLASPLVDKIPASECSQTLDARGVTRPQGDSCDIGAVEATYPDGAGPNDLTLAFEGPEQWIPGKGHR
jgi:hypothetical protein